MKLSLTLLSLILLLSASLFVDASPLFYSRSDSCPKIIGDTGMINLIPYSSE